MWFTDSDVGAVEDGREVGDGGEVGEGEGGRETEMEEMRAVFQSTLQAQTDSSRGKPSGVNVCECTVCVYMNVLLFLSVQLNH